MSRHRLLRPIFNMQPRLGENTWIAPSATVVGSVEVGSGTAIWYNAVIRGDSVDKVSIGNNVTVGDRALLQVGTGAAKTTDTIVQDNVTIRMKIL